MITKAMLETAIAGASRFHTASQYLAPTTRHAQTSHPIANMRISILVARENVVDPFFARCDARVLPFGCAAREGSIGMAVATEHNSTSNVFAATSLEGCATWNGPRLPLKGPVESSQGCAEQSTPSISPVER